MNPEFEKQLRSISENISAFGEKIDAQGKRFNDLQTQIDAIDVASKDRLTSFQPAPQLVELLKSNADVQKLITNRRGSAVINFGAKELPMLQRKTTITEIQQGFAVTGVMPIERIPGITTEARQTLTVRDLLAASPTVQAVVDFVRVQTPMTIASPVPEGSNKPENQLIFNSLSEKVRTLATWIPASKQILDDMQELASTIQGSLVYYTNLAEELQLLSGDSTGENLHGLIPQASIFNTAGLPAGSTKIDCIGAVIGSIQTAKELPPTFAIVHPADWWSMRLLKDTLGRYIIGDPASTAAARLFDLDVVATTSIGKGSFLVGNGTSTGAEIRDRMEMQVEISTEHSTFFIQNLVAIRAEKRLALCVKRPASFVTGSFGSLS
jgi:HK97 family phage major capsid protein